MAFLTFLARLLQRFLKLLDFLGELRKVMVYGITFLTALSSGAEIRFLLPILLKPTTITSVVCGICAPMLLAQVACFSKQTFLGTLTIALVPGRFFPFLLL
jgi:hypothetical protein